MPTLEDQINLEIDMANAGYDRFMKDASKHEEAGSESLAKHGRVIIAGSIKTVAESLHEYINTKSSNRERARKFLKDMDLEVVAYLGLITVVDSISSQKALLMTARTVGDRIESQNRLDRYVEEHGQIAKRLIKQANDKKGANSYEHKKNGLNNVLDQFNIESDWEFEDKLHVGLKVIDHIIKATGLVQISTIRKRGKSVSYLMGTEATLEWLKNFKEKNAAALPRYAPSIYPPKPWTDITGGGYHSEAIKPFTFVRLKG